MSTSRDEEKTQYRYSPGNSLKRPSHWLHISIIAVTITALLITIFLAYQSYTQSRLGVLDDFNMQQLVLTRSAAAGVETLFAEVKATLTVAVSCSPIQRMTPDCLDYMRHLSGGFLPKTSIRRIDERGILRYIHPQDDWRNGLLGRQYGDQEYFRNAMKENAGMTLQVVMNEQGDRRLRMAVPVFTGGPDGAPFRKFAGVLVVSFDIEGITDAFISPITSGKTGQAWLVDENGTVIAHRDSRYIGSDVFTVWEEQKVISSSGMMDTIRQNMKSGREGADLSTWKEHRGQKAAVEKLIAYSPVHVLNHLWSFAVVTPVSEADVAIRATARKTIYGFGFIVLVLVGAGSFISVTAYRWSASLEREVKNRTKELRETTDYLDKLIRNAHTPIIVWNQDRQITVFNRAFERMSGWSEQEMVGQSITVLFPGDGFIDLLETLPAARENVAPGAREIPVVRKDGGLRIGLWTSSRVRADDGETMIATLVQGEDITERKITEEALQKSEAYYRAVVEAQTELICRFTPDWRITFVNEAYCRCFNKNQQELIGKSFMPFIPEDSQKEVEKLLRDLLENKVAETKVEHLVINGKGDLRWQQWVNRAIFDESGRVVEFQSVGRDITDLKRAQEEKKKLEAQLYHAQKIDTLGALVAGVAHEINNPVNKIIYDIPLLKKIWMDVLSVLGDRSRKMPNQKYGGLTYTFLKDNLPAMLADMELAANRVARTVGSLKDYTRKSSIADKRPMQINAAVENAVRLIETTIKTSGITLTTDLAEVIPLIEGNIQSIEQIIINIVVNALQAIHHDHGRIVIKTGMLEEGRRVFISISDNGEGIDPFISDRIFDPFITNRHNSGGTGLGLAITRNLVEAHGGDISLKSTRGEGTVFTIFFPTTGLESWY
jgi:PAS domain S-box-containing protein